MGVGNEAQLNLAEAHTIQKLPMPIAHLKQ